MTELAFLLDAPAQPTQRLQIAKLGDFTDKRYGDFSITRADVEAWQRNLAALPGGRGLIDLDHRADRKPRSTEAAGWITSVGMDGDTPVADVEWTSVGRDAIADKRYLFFSPSYGPFKDEHGTVHDNTLLGGALTNRPFLSSMPMVTLASEERVSEAAGRELAVLLDRIDEQQINQLDAAQRLRLLAVLTGKQRDDLDDSDFAIPGKRAYPIHDLPHARNALARVSQFGSDDDQAQVKAAVYKRYPQLKPSSDSPRTMDSATLIKTLGLDDGADDATILEAIGQLKQPAAGETRTLEQQAAQEGKVLLDRESLTNLQQQASAGAQAARQLHDERFEKAFDDAVRARKVTPSERDGIKEFYELDADRTLKMLEARPAIMPEKPIGQPVLEFDPEQPADPQQLMAAGVHPGNHELHMRIQKHLLDNKLPDSDYGRILDGYMKGQVRL